MRIRTAMNGSSAGFALALLSAALVASPVAAAESPSATPPAKSTPMVGEAVRMYRDPATGELRPATAEELAALQASRGNVKRQPLVVKSHGGRMVSAVVGDRALEELVAERDASGKLVIGHRASGQAPAPASAKREER